MAPNFLTKFVKASTTSNNTPNGSGTNTPRERVSSDVYSSLRQAQGSGDIQSVTSRERAKSASNGSTTSIGLGSPTTPTQANTLFNARSSSRRNSTKDSGESQAPSRIPSIITTLSGTVGRNRSSSKRDSKDKEKDLKKEKEKNSGKQESEETLNVQAGSLQPGDRTSWSSEYSSQPNFTIIPPSPLVRNGELDSDSENEFNPNDNDNEGDRPQVETPKTAGTQEEQPEDVVTPTLPKTNQGASKTITPVSGTPASPPPTQTTTTTTATTTSSKSPNPSAFSGSTSNTATPVGTPILPTSNKSGKVNTNNTHEHDMSNLTPGAYQVRKQPSNKSLTKKTPPDIDVAVAMNGNGSSASAGASTSAHARSATEPPPKAPTPGGQDVVVNGAVTMKPIVESPTDLKFPTSSSSTTPAVNQQSSPPPSSILSPSTSTSTSTSSSSNAHALGNMSINRENTSSSILSPDASKSKRPWRRSTTRKPTGLASAIAATGMAMANPSLSAVHNAQISQIAPPAPPPPPPPPPLALPLLSAGSSKGDKDKQSIRSKSKSRNGDLSPRSNNSRKSSVVGSPPRARSRRASSAKSDMTGDYASSSSKLPRPPRTRTRTRPDYYGNLTVGEVGDGAGNVSYGEESHSDSGSGSGSESGSDSGSESDGRFSSDDMEGGDDDGIDSLGGFGEDDIPVTGFAVASNKRNADFHELFPSVPEGDYLIEDYGCALQREILIQGRIYISENHICFHANIFGWITDLSIPIYEITSLEKKMTAFVIPNAIQITTRQSKYTFASFLSRDTTFDVIYNIWRLARPEDSASFMSSGRGSVDGPGGSVMGGGGKGSSINGSAIGVNSKVSSVKAGSVGVPAAVVAAGVGDGIAPARKATQCSCGNKHFTETAMDVTLPGTPEKIHNLIFASGFIKDFMVVNQKLLDIQMSDWAPVAPGSKLLTRNFSYIKPLNGSLGPKQTKCELKDEMVFVDPESSFTTVTTTRTPDVPSGGVFSVKTRTCITWAGPISSRVLVTTQVEWTGRSFIKGIIERSAIDGQKVYHAELEKAMRAYIQEHNSEFLPEGIDAAAVALAPPEPETTPSAAEKAAEVSEKHPPTSDEQYKQRERERNARSLQWAWDTFDGAFQVAKRSTKGALELIRDAWDQSTSTTILWFVIVVLVLSNLWTLMRMGASKHRADRKLETRRAEERDRWAHSIVTAMWEELAAGGGPPVLGMGPDRIGTAFPGRVTLPPKPGMQDYSKLNVPHHQQEQAEETPAQEPFADHHPPLPEISHADDLETRRAKKSQLEGEILQLHEQLHILEQRVMSIKTTLAKDLVINDLD